MWHAKKQLEHPEHTWGEKKQAWRITFSNFRTYRRATVMSQYGTEMGINKRIYRTEARSQKQTHTDAVINF